jgi:hypothetical protein
MSQIPLKSLWVVDHFDKTSTPKRIESLSEEWFDLIVRFFKKKPISDVQASQVVAKLQDLSLKDRWLLCECTSHKEYGCPVLYPVRLPGKTREATLVSIYDRGEHITDCPFYKERPISLQGIAELPRNTKSDGLGVQRALKGGGSAPKSLSSRPASLMTKRKRMPTLARVLFTILEGAGVNVVRSKRENSSTQLPLIQAFIDKQFLDSSKKISAARLIVLGFASKSTLESEIIAKKDSFGRLMPQGMIIDVVDSHQSHVGSHVLKSGKSSLTFDGRLFVPGQRNTPGPWLAIALVVIMPNEPVPEIKQVYLHPLAQIDSYVLVDSDLERKTLNIMKSRLWQMSGANKPFSIIKPLTDRVVQDQGVRPDFIVESGDEWVVVETMGFTDDEYLERKAHTQELMTNLPNVSRLLKHEKSQDKAFLSDFDSFVGRPRR